MALGTGGGSGTTWRRVCWEGQHGLGIHSTGRLVAGTASLGTGTAETQHSSTARSAARAQATANREDNRCFVLGGFTAAANGEDDGQSGELLIGGGCWIGRMEGRAVAGIVGRDGAARDGDRQPQWRMTEELESVLIGFVGETALTVGRGVGLPVGDGAGRSQERWRRRGWLHGRRHRKAVVGERWPAGFEGDGGV